MATPPKTTSDHGVTAPKPAAATKAGADPQKVDFDLDPEVKKQLDAGGSYKPTAEKIAEEYHPPGPHPIGEGVGGASGGVKMSTDDVAATSPAPTTEKK